MYVYRIQTRSLHFRGISRVIRTQRSSCWNGTRPPGSTITEYLTFAAAGGILRLPGSSQQLLEGQTHNSTTTWVHHNPRWDLNQTQPPPQLSHVLHIVSKLLANRLKINEWVILYFSSTYLRSLLSGKIDLLSLFFQINFRILLRITRSYSF